MKVTTLERYDPNASRDFSTLRIGGHVVQRQPLPGTTHTLYSVMHNGRVAGRLISYPSAEDCESVKRQARDAKERQAERTQEIEAAGGIGPLTDRIVRALRTEKMGLGRLGKALNSNPDALSPILARLAKQGRILRRGARGKYVYEAA